MLFRCVHGYLGSRNTGQRWLTLSRFLWTVVRGFLTTLAGERSMRNRHLFYPLVAASAALMPSAAFGEPIDIKVTPQVQDKYHLEYLNCLDRSVRSLDDGISDAYTIGRAASNRCIRERNNLVAVMMHAENKRVRAQFAEAMVERSAQDGAETVLRYRSLGRNR